MKSKQYWKDRAIERMSEYHRDSMPVIATVTRAYDDAIKQIDEDIERILNKFAKDGKLTPEEAIKLLNADEDRAVIEELRRRIATVKDPAIRRQLLNRINAPAYKFRISRLEALKEAAYIESKRIADVEIARSTALYKTTIEKAYYRSMFDLQKGVGLAFDFAQIDDKRIQSILKNPWSGKHFSERVWRNTDILAKRVSDVITSGFMSGRSVRSMSLELQELSLMGKHAAVRLVRSEVTYMANAAEIESYKETGVDRYQFLATLSLRTCDTCGSLDGKQYKVDEAVPGTNLPTMHPNCRCTTIPVVDGQAMSELQRRAKDPITGEPELVPGDMTFEQWRGRVDAKYGEGTVDKLRKMRYNEAADKKQFTEYRKRLGNLAPSKFADFQRLKYDSPTQYAELSGLYRYKGRVAEATVSDYQAYKAIKATGIKGVVRVPPEKPKRAFILEDLSSRDPAHIMKRMFERHITDDEVQSFVDNALFTIEQFKGTRLLYCSEEGVTVLTKTNDYPGLEWIAKTTWSKHDFKEIMEKAVKEALKHGK